MWLKRRYLCALCGIHRLLALFQHHLLCIHRRFRRKSRTLFFRVRASLWMRVALCRKFPWFSYPCKRLLQFLFALHRITTYRCSSLGKMTAACLKELGNAPGHLGRICKVPTGKEEFVMISIWSHKFSSQSRMAVNDHLNSEFECQWIYQ